jgi:hypothetical protein
LLIGKLLIRNRGEDFDDRLADYLADIFESTTSASRTRIKTDARAMSRLRAAAERAKRVLSSAMTTKVEVESLSGGKDLSVTVTRTEFENCCMDLFKSTTRILDQVLRPIRINSRLDTFFNRDTGALDPKCIDEVSYILSFRLLKNIPFPLSSLFASWAGSSPLALGINNIRLFSQEDLREFQRSKR